MACASVCSWRQRNERRPSWTTASAPAASDRSGSAISLRVHLLDHAEAAAGRARAVRGVEREQPRRELGEGDAAVGAGMAGGEHELFACRCGAIRTTPSASLSAGLQRVGETVAEVGAHLEAVDDDLDGVLASSCRGRAALAASTSWPSTRARTKPSRSIARTACGARPLRRSPRCQSTKRLPSGIAMMRSTICWVVWPWIGMPQSGQCARPIAANSRRR